MFRIVNRLIQWTGKYKRRIYIGFVYAFIHSIFTAIPIMLAAKGLSAVLDDWGGIEPLESRDIWIMLGTMILAVLGRYLFSYLRAITQESVVMKQPLTKEYGWEIFEAGVAGLFQ